MCSFPKLSLIKKLNNVLNSSINNTITESEMEKAVVVPDSVSRELFENAFRSYFKNESIQILQYTSKAALTVGENFASDIFRSTVTYSLGKNGKKETISVIIKCFPENQMMRNLIQGLQLFEREAYIYTKILPAIDNFLGSSKQTSPKCIHYDEKGTNSIIIFEDLSAMNFKMHPRQQGLDLQHCLLVVEKLAYLHATSLVLYEKDPSLINNKFTESMLGTSEYIENWVSNVFKALIEASAKWPGFEKYSVKLKAIQDKAIERLLKTTELSNFNVLNHGDCWINNFMFSYNSDGKVKDLRFVDFQRVVYGTPTIDLHYFIVSSPSIEVRNQHLDTILDHYYEKLTETLDKLKYPLTSVPSGGQLREDFNSRAFCGLVGAVTVLPLVTASNRDDATFEALVVTDGDKDDFQHDSFNNERYRKHMEFLLPFYDNLGILD